MSFKLLVTIVNCNRVNMFQSRFVQSKNAMNVRWSRESIVNFFYLPGAVLIVGDFSLLVKGERPIVRRRRIRVVVLESLWRQSPDVVLIRPQVGFVRQRIGVVRRPMKSATISPGTAKNDCFPSCRFHTYFQSHHTTSLAPLDHLSLLTCSCPLLLNHFRSLHLVLVGSSSYFGCLTLSGSKSPLPKKRWYKIKNVVLTSWFLSRWLKIVEDSWKALEIDELVLSLKLFVCTVAKAMKWWKISWQRMIYNEEFCTVRINWMKIKVEKYVEIFVDIWFW